MGFSFGFLKSLVKRLRNQSDNLDSDENKTYIYDKANDYYDHLEPKLMSRQEIENMPMEIEAREQPQNNSIIIDSNTGKQTQVGNVQMQQLKTRGRDIVIPGQVLRDQNGNVKKIPLRTDHPTLPNQGGQQPPQYQGGYPQGYPAPQQPQPYPQPVQRVQSVPVGEVVYNVFKLEDAAYLYIELPGADKTTLDVQVSDRNVSVSCEYLDYAKMVNEAEMAKKEAKKKKNYILEHKTNVSKPKFSDAYELPSSINEEGIVAKFENGILELYLPYRSIEQKKVGIKVL